MASENLFIDNKICDDITINVTEYNQEGTNNCDNLSPQIKVDFLLGKYEIVPNEDPTKKPTIKVDKTYLLPNVSEFTHDVSYDEDTTKFFQDAGCTTHTLLGTDNTGSLTISKINAESEIMDLLQEMALGCKKLCEFERWCLLVKFETNSRIYKIYYNLNIKPMPIQMLSDALWTMTINFTIECRPWKIKRIAEEKPEAAKKN